MTKHAPKPETQLMRQVLQTLGRLGYRAIRINSGTLLLPGRAVKGAPKGTPDILVLSPYVWLEVKRPKQQLRPEQAEFAAWCKANGVACVTVETVADAVKAVEFYSRQERKKRSEAS